LAQLAIGSKISPETYVLIVKILDVGPDLDRLVEDRIWWPKWHGCMTRYGSFVTHDLREAAKTLRSAVI
jgi:hypothetical protein